MSVVNTLAYYTKETLTAVKKFYSTGLLGEQKMTSFGGRLAGEKLCHHGSSLQYWLSPDQNVNKAEELTHLPINIGSNLVGLLCKSLKPLIFVAR
jgi:hypothetical protein